MKRSEEAATKAYGGVPQLRRAFLHGYEQAEKDLALTWEDIQRIHEITDELVERMEAQIIEPYFRNEQTFYEEALRRFAETKQMESNQ